MTQLTEITISVRRGLSNLGETTEAEVSATFKIQKGDNDLTALVGDKFQAVRTALIEALESEPRRQESKKTERKIEDSASHGPSPAVVASASNEDIAVQVDHRAEVSSDEGEINATGTALAEATPGAQEEPNLQPAPPTFADVEVQKVTAAQQRTVESLRQSAGLNDEQLRALLETSFNRKRVQDLTKREAASLILNLSQRQRERIIRHKPDLISPEAFSAAEKENISLNGKQP